MSDKLIEKLRDPYYTGENPCPEAADRIEELEADKAELVKAGNRLTSQWLMCLDLGDGESMDLGEFDIHINEFKLLLSKHTGDKP